MSTSKELVLVDPRIPSASKRCHRASSSPTTPTARRCKGVLALEEQPPSGEAVPMEQDIVPTPSPSRKKGTQVNVFVIGSPNEDYIVVQDVLRWASLLSTLTTFGGVVDPLDLVVSNVVLAHPDDALEMEQLVFRTFRGGASPDHYDFAGGVRSKLWYRSGKKRKSTLGGGKDMIHRAHKGQSFAWVMPLAVAWPPPLCCGPEDGCSFLWSVKLDFARKELPQIEQLVKSLAENYVGYACHAVRNVSVDCLLTLSDG